MCMVKTKNRGWVQLGDGKVCVNSNDVQGVYRSQDINEVRADLSARHDRFNVANAIQNTLEKLQHFSGDSFDDKGHLPLRGAFGEKL